VGASLNFLGRSPNIISRGKLLAIILADFFTSVLYALYTENKEFFKGHLTLKIEADKTKI
jgi:hypothetical protein